LVAVAWWATDAQACKALSGRVKPDVRKFSLDIAFDTTPQRFDGYLNGYQSGVMGRTPVWSGMQFVFYGARRP
jgi:hypothetical protein